MITVVLLNCVVVRQTNSGQFTNTSINYPYVTNNRPRMSHPSFSLHGVREEVRVRGRLLQLIKPGIFRGEGKHVGKLASIK